MACKPICTMCKHLVAATSVTYTALTGLVINLPSGTYNDGEKYCIIVQSAIPPETPIGANVSVSIGGVLTQLYPLLRQDGTQAKGGQIRSRRRYSTVVETTATSGSFRLLGALPCCETAKTRQSLPVQVTADATSAAAGA